MIAREESIFRQAQMRIRTAPNQKRVVLIEGKCLAGVWPSLNSEINLLCSLGNLRKLLLFNFICDLTGELTVKININFPIALRPILLQRQVGVNLCFLRFGRVLQFLNQMVLHTARINCYPIPF